MTDFEQNNETICSLAEQEGTLTDEQADQMAHAIAENVADMMTRQLTDEQSEALDRFFQVL
jgi:mono/diheme cytochrome c family protein